ncbi:MAG: hypothetical protein V1495_05020 [Pseudomonadota bacterium]
MSGTEQRKHRRQTVAPENAGASVDIGGVPRNGVLLNYCGDGLGLMVEGANLEELLQRNKGRIGIRLGEDLLLGTARSVRAEAWKARVGVRIEEQKNDLFFRSTDLNWDLIEDSETIATLLEDLTSSGARAPIVISQGKVFGSGIWIGGVKDPFIAAQEISTHWVPGPIRCELTLFGICHVFDTVCTGKEGQQLRVQAPTRVVRLLRRETVRVSATTADGVRGVRVEHPILGKSQNRISVLELSEKGLLVRDPSEWIHVPVGVRFPLMAVELTDGDEILGSGEVRGGRFLATGEYAVGLRFTPATYEAKTRWHNFVLGMRYAGLHFEYKESDHGKIWELYDRSGYLDMKPRESFTPLVDVTKQSWRSLSEAGTGLAKRLLIRAGENVVGNMQLDRIYPKAWCAHGLAIDPSVSKIVAGQIYAATADILSAEGASYLYTITNADLAWNQRNYYDFVQRYPFPEHNELRKFYLHEADTAKGWDLTSPPGLVTKPASSYDLRRIERYFEVHGSAIERDALGFDFANLTMESLDRELKPHGLARQRSFLVGTMGGRFAGFAMAETGTLGTSLFGMQYTLYVHVMPEMGADSHAVYEGLLREGLELYRQWGVQNVNVYMQECRREHFEVRGLRYIEEAIRWISNCAATQRYTAFSQMMYGHLMLRRELHKQRTREN